MQPCDQVNNNGTMSRNKLTEKKSLFSSLADAAAGGDGGTFDLFEDHSIAIKIFNQFWLNNTFRLLVICCSYH